MPGTGLVAGFLVGLLGSGHCAGMCGGIVGALSSQPGSARLSRHLAYSAGRIGSYAIAGAIAGMTGGLGMMLSGVLPVQLALYLAANVILLLLGLQLAGVSSVPTRLEVAGRWLWRRVEPLGRRLLPADTAAKSLAVGGAAEGAALMAAFGLGTLPSLLAAGLLVRDSGRVLRSQTFRTVCGALVFGFAASGLAQALDLGEQIRRGILCIG